MCGATPQNAAILAITHLLHGVKSVLMATKSTELLPGKGFTFVPRDLFESPRRFGKTREDLRPAKGVSILDPRFKAALLQHHLSKEIREHLSSRSKTVAWLASSKAGHPGLSTDRMHRMLRGETMLQVADLLLFTQIAKDGIQAVQDAIGVDPRPAKALKDSHMILSWAMGDCTCNSAAKAMQDLKRFRDR